MENERGRSKQIPCSTVVSGQCPCNLDPENVPDKNALQSRSTVTLTDSPTLGTHYNQDLDGIPHPSVECVDLGRFQVGRMHR